MTVLQVLAADMLTDVLAGEPSSEGAAIVGWRFEVFEGQSVRVGLRKGVPGGPYEAPSAATRLVGSLELWWSDGAVSRVGLDRAALTVPADRLSEWRAAASTFRWRAPLPGPTTLPIVQTFDPAVAEVAMREAAPLFGLLIGAMGQLARGRLGSAAVSAGGPGGTGHEPATAERVSGSASASVGRRVVRSSAGFRAAWDETRCTLELTADERVSVRYGSRRWPAPGELAALLADLAETSARMSVEEVIPTRVRGVLFAPEAFEVLLRRFLVPNLDAQAMLEGRAPFSLDDVRSGRQVAASSVSMRVDTTLPFALATSPCSAAGVPAGVAELVAGGRLRRPLVDPGAAAAAGFAATPAPRGRPLLVVTSDAGLDGLDAALGVLGDGVVVREVMGLHTQDARRGSYSLLVPEAQVVRGGRPGGRASARVSGNFLTQLLSPTNAIVRRGESRDPGFLVIRDVTVEAV